MGRPQGSKNAKTEAWEQFSIWFATNAVKRLPTEMDKLEGREFVYVVKDLLEYFQPRLARTELTGKDGKDLPPPQININLTKIDGEGTKHQLSSGVRDIVEAEEI